MGMTTYQSRKLSDHLPQYLILTDFVGKVKIISEYCKILKPSKRTKISVDKNNHKTDGRFIYKVKLAVLLVRGSLDALFFPSCILWSRSHKTVKSPLNILSPITDKHLLYRKHILPIV